MMAMMMMMVEELDLMVCVQVPRTLLVVSSKFSQDYPGCQAQYGKG